MPTFSLTELPPHVPQPSVSEGSSLKLYRSPIPPCDEGVFTTIRQVFIRSLNSLNTSCLLSKSIYIEEVCPYPPSAISLSAFAKASFISLALYMASTGESFSCANSSESSTDSTSPISTLADFGTFTPESSAILYAVWPTILALSEPFMMMVLRTLSISSSFKK